MPFSKPEESKKNKANPFLRFTGLAFQMGILIALGAWGGSAIDDSLNFKKPVFTIILSLIGIGIALYLVIKEAIKSSKDE